MATFGTAIENDQQSVISNQTQDLFTHEDILPLGIYIQPVLRMFVCKQCEIALLGANIGQHFQRAHSDIQGFSIPTTKITKLEAQYSLKMEMPSIQGPIPELYGLTLHKDCVKCPECATIYSKNSLRMHYSRDHSSQKRVDPNSLPTIFAQNLTHGTHSKLFEVYPLPKQYSETTLSPTIINKLRQARDALVEPYRPQELDVRAISPWLLAVDWHNHVLPFDINELGELVALPKKDTPFFNLGRAMEALFDQAYRVMEKSDTLILQKINSSYPDKEGYNNTPFKKHQHQESLTDCSNVCIRLLALLLRPKKHYHIPLPQAVQREIKTLTIALEKDKVDDAKNACYNILFRLWTHLWTKSDTNSIGDPTICLLALSMLKPDGGFQTPANTTPFIAKLCYSMRLIFLLAISAKAKKTDENLAYDHYKKYITEKNPYTFNSLRTLQHLGSSIAYSQLSMPRVVWTDRIGHTSMYYQGDEIKFSNIQDIFSAMEQKAISTWETEILLGLPLRASYTKIHDSIANTTVGYSMFSDPRNKCFEDRDILAKAIIIHPQLSKIFLSTNLDQNGQPQWNVLALQKWLFSYAKFHGIQLANVEMKAGSPGRGTEISCLEYRNTRTRPQRGVHMINNHFSILCQYSKLGSITGTDKVIPHSLDAVTSDLMIQDLAIARPFAELAAFICYPTNKDIQGRYNSYLFVNNKDLFTTTQLTNIIKSYTLPVLQVGLGVSDWRHISAAFRRKICPGLAETIEDDGHETIQALQSGHSRSTENRIYGISTDALAGPAEDILPLFLDASTDWQVACKIVPGGHLLPYSEARMSAFEHLASQKKIKANYTTPITSVEQAMAKILKAIESSHQLQAQAIVNILEPLLEQKIVARLEALLDCKLDKFFDKYFKKDVTKNYNENNLPPIQESQQMDTTEILPITPLQSTLQVSPQSQTPPFTLLQSNTPSVFATPMQKSSSSHNSFSEIQRPITLSLHKYTQPSILQFDIENEDTVLHSSNSDTITHLLAPLNIGNEELESSTNILTNAQRSSTIYSEEIANNQEVEQQDFQILPDSHEHQALALLRTYTKNPTATWTSPLQFQALQHIAEYKEDVILIMATGSGKTMVAIISTLLPDYMSISIIILPLNSLITDYKRKFDAMGLSYDHYTAKTVALREDVRFIFVSVDMAKTKGFKTAVTNLNEINLVQRLFFDETQLAYTENSYRKSLNDLQYLRYLSFQVILFTGTAPKNTIPFLMQSFGLTKETTILRGPTDRPELEYIHLPKFNTFPDILDKVCNIIEEYRITKQDQDRILVFTPFITEGHLLAKHLQCDFYYGAAPNREQIYLSWFHGKTDVLVATSALSAGNDCPSVSLVIHANTPRDIITYIQELGRGGRKGQPTKCYLLPMAKYHKTQIQGPDYQGKETMHNLVWNKSSCIRYTITSHCDGQGVYCNDHPSRQLCSWCRNRAFLKKPISRPSSITQFIPLQQGFSTTASVLSHSTSQKSALLPTMDSKKRKLPDDENAFQDQQQAAKRQYVKYETSFIQYVDHFKTALAIITPGCAYCTALKETNNSHLFLQCPTLGSQRGAYLDFKKTIRYPSKYPNASCWFCHIPQCREQLHPLFTNAEDCQYPDIIAPIAFAIFHHPHLRQLAEDNFNIEWPDISTFVGWLISSPLAGIETNISALFLWLVDEMYNI